VNPGSLVLDVAREREFLPDLPIRQDKSSIMLPLILYAEWRGYFWRLPISIPLRLCASFWGNAVLTLKPTIMTSGIRYLLKSCSRLEVLPVQMALWASVVEFDIVAEPIDNERITK
jgi:hypothetical protein